MINPRNIIAKILMVKPDSITLESDYTSVASWDSLTQINIIFKLEEETQKRFTPKEISEMTSVRGILKALTNNGIEWEGFEEI